LAPSGKSAKGFNPALIKQAPKKKISSEDDDNNQNENNDHFLIDQTIYSSMNRDRKANRVLSRAEEFEVFKKGKGNEMSRILAENKQTLKLKKRQAKELAEQVNNIKRQIDEIKAELEHKNLNLQPNGFFLLYIGSQIIIDQKEYQNIAKLKTLKEEYKKFYDALKPMRADIDYCFKLTDQCRQKLMAEFEQWYESIYGPQLSEQHKGADVILY
jgi:kinesin family protein 6/9